MKSLDARGVAAPSVSCCLSHPRAASWHSLRLVDTTGCDDPHLAKCMFALADKDASGAVNWNVSVHVQCTARTVSEA